MADPAHPPMQAIDPIDEAMQVTNPAGWVQLAAVASGVVVALIWASMTDVPIKTSGRGLLLSGNGVAEVTLAVRGRISSLAVQPGDVISAGALVAEISQPDQEMQITLREVQLREATGREVALLAFRRRSGDAQDSVALARIVAARQRIELLTERERALRERETISADLFRRGLTTREVILRNQSELVGVVDQIASARADIVSAQNELQLQGVQGEKELLSAREEITRLAAEVAEARAQLARNRELRSSDAGRVLEIKHGAGDFVEAGAAVLLLEREAAPGEIVAVAYVAPESGKEVRPGMRVDVAPAGVKSNEFGFISGRVTAVSDSPVSTAGMQRTLRNDQLVRQLSANGAPFQVEIALDRAATPSGFRWSASNGPSRPIGSGTPVEAHVITRQSRLIGLVVPPLARFFAR